MLFDQNNFRRHPDLKLTLFYFAKFFQLIAQHICQVILPRFPAEQILDTLEFWVGGIFVINISTDFTAQYLMFFSQVSLFSQ